MSGEGKIIRDKVDVGAMRPYARATNMTERIRMLKEKLVKEAAEAVLAPTDEEVIEELADVIEVAFALDRLLGLGDPKLPSMLRVMLAKQELLGGFEQGKALAWEPWEDYNARKAAADEHTQLTQELEES